MKLYTFWRSIATYRVRIALNLKDLSVETEQINLLKGEQHRPDYAAVNPQHALPSLVLDEGGAPLFQSMAIMEYLDETHPLPRLLPSDPRGRARVRGLSHIAVSDAHPLSVPRVRHFLTDEYKFDEAQLNNWLRHWQAEALRAFEWHLANEPETGTYCHGDSVTMADICLAGQAVGAGFFGVELAPYPTVARIVEACTAQEAFARAHPLKQPGAPASA